MQVQLSAVRTGKTLRITIADDGAGYPPAVLHALQTGEAGENTPHILGLHVVEQIIRAHGGTAAFARNAPRGAKAFPQNRVFRRAAGRVCPAPTENAIFFYSHKKIILILVDFLGITLYNVYYK